MIQIEFHGAAHTVTGSCYLVRTDHGTFIVDCGMFQGPDVEHRNLEDFDFDASKVDFVLLTHAHIDHSGMLPKLYKNGFRGKIYATHHTIQIASLLLMDSAKIQENNFQRGQKYGKFVDTVAIVYNSFHAEETVNLFESVPFGKQIQVNNGISIKFVMAGHILGAASIEVDIKDGAESKEILFSGDIGRENQSLIDIFDHEYKSKPDYILMESLYGGEFHPDRDESAERLIEIIKTTISRGGNVYIPSFAVHRTQEILRDIKLAQEDGRLSKEIPVYLDSPLAQKVCHIYTTALQRREDSIFTFDSLTFVRKHKQSLSVARQKGMVVIAGSGMADGGRIMEHLSIGLKDKKNCVVFVGYQAEGTLGRELSEGAESVVIGKSVIPVNAEIVHLHGFSGHGDTSDIKNWVKRFKSDKLKKIFLIHAEEDRAEQMQKVLEEMEFENIHIPEWKEKMQLS